METKYKHVWDKSLFKEMTGFAGWSLFGNLSSVLSGQGLNMLLNVFFGPVVNAARAIAVQVQNAVQQFVGNFQMALNPQITKTYAKGEMKEMHKLMFRSARFSFYLLYLLSLPVLFETNYILTIWLKNVPENTVVFLRIMICISLMYTLSNPLMVANQSTGMVKKYQIICGGIQLLILPISYIYLKLGFSAYTVFLVHLVMESITQLARMIMLRKLINIHLQEYFKNIYVPVLSVVMLSTIIPYIIYHNLNYPSTTLRFFTTCITCAISVSSVIYLIGLSINERLFIRSKIIRLLR